MRIHHLNCGSMCPVPGKPFGGERWLGPATMCCHCLLIEGPSGLVLVDTGLGLRAVREPESELSSFFRFGVRPQLREEETALRQVEKLGFKASDVRHILVTHLDVDHAGGLADFPQAQVHLLEKEQRTALNPPTPRERKRYRQIQWAHGPKWELYGAADGERWFGFEAVRGLRGLPPEFLLVPLHGHTRGHAAVAVQSEGRWLLHAGDAYFYSGEVHSEPPSCPPGLRFFQWNLAPDNEERLRNQARLRALASEHRSDVTVFCAHDPRELAPFVANETRPSAVRPLDRRNA